MDPTPARRIPSDIELLSAIPEGHDTAAAELRLRHDPSVLAAVRSVLNRGCEQRREHEGEVNDEAWMTIFNKLHQLRDLSKFDAWRDEVARNVARAHLKKCIPTHDLFVQPNADGSFVSEGSVRSLVETLEAAELADQIMELAEGISPTFADALALRAGEGCRWDEIATRLGKNTATLRKSYQRDLIKLKILIKLRKKSGGRGG